MIERFERYNPAEISCREFNDDDSDLVVADFIRVLSVE